MFAGWKTAAAWIVLAIADYVASLGYDVLNHGPNGMVPRTPIDQALPAADLGQPATSASSFAFRSPFMFGR